jgi:hypothetical protein
MRRREACRLAACSKVGLRDGLSIAEARAVAGRGAARCSRFRWLGKRLAGARIVYFDGPE